MEAFRSIRLILILSCNMYLHSSGSLQGLWSPDAFLHNIIVSLLFLHLPLHFSSEVFSCVQVKTMIILLVSLKPLSPSQGQFHQFHLSVPRLQHHSLHYGDSHSHQSRHPGTVLSRISQTIPIVWHYSVLYSSIYIWSFFN